MTHLIALYPSLKKVYPSLPLHTVGTSAIVVYRLASDVKESDRFVVGARYATFPDVSSAHEYLLQNVVWYGDMWDGPPLEILEAEYAEYVRCRSHLKSVK